jgi:hypothetical protein
MKAYYKIFIFSSLMMFPALLNAQVLITEPAVGYGIAGAALFFHSSYSEKKGPPSLSGVMGG